MGSRAMTNVSKQIVPLRALLEFEGWSIQSRRLGPDSCELVAVNPQSQQKHSIIAASEDTALADLARRVGWKDVD